MTGGQRRLGLVVAALLVLAGLVFLFWPEARTTALRPVNWRAQPDLIPLGTVLQGSRVEMSVGFISDIKPAGPPSWVAQLPQWLRQWSVTGIRHLRAMQTKHAWRIEVEAPDYLQVDRAWVEYHQVHGAFPTVNLNLPSDQPGNHDGKVTVRLARRGYVTTTMTIPVRVNVLAKPSRWHVLLTDTPFERYATGDGRIFEPLAGINTRLAEQGVRLDFLHDLPKSLDGWNAILVGGTTLVRLDAARVTRLQQFVARGGRLIVCADAFFWGSHSKANDLVNPYGLRLADQDAAPGIPSSRILSDPFTTGVTNLTFRRPVCVSLVDPRQAKFLATMTEDEQCGFIAVSRAAGRGEVIVLAQSLWWNWVRSELGDGDNAKLLENLLAP